MPRQARGSLCALTSAAWLEYLFWDHLLVISFASLSSGIFPAEKNICFSIICLVSTHLLKGCQCGNLHASLFPISASGLRENMQNVLTSPLLLSRKQWGFARDQGAACPWFCSSQYLHFLPAQPLLPALSMLRCLLSSVAPWLGWSKLTTLCSMLGWCHMWWEQFPTTPHWDVGFPWFFLSLTSFSCEL